MSYSPPMDANQGELLQLREALRHTQDQVMALEAQVRVLASCLALAGAVPAELLVEQLTQAIRQLHGRHGEEFPQVTRSLIELRDFLRGEGPPAPSP